MCYGRGFGMGGRGGFQMGYGFRGYSPAWPYVGRGRGGLPRCFAYPPHVYAPNVPYGAPEDYYFHPEMGPPPYYYPGGFEEQAPYPPPGGFGSYGAPFPGPPPTPKQEVEFLAGQARMLKEQLDQIDARIGELEEEEG